MVGFAGSTREFPLLILCGDGGEGTICKLVPLCALIAQTEGLRFWPTHSHSLMFICSLHKCNYCSVVGFAGNIREFPLRIQCCDGAGGTICKLVPLCTLIAQTEGLRFWLPHYHSFILICSLHYCSVVGFAGNFREFPFLVLCGDGAGGAICKLVPLCALIAQTDGLRFRHPHSHSFLLICSLH